ncbi:MAG: ATP-binding protein, partial [Chloroflexota bacterium]|nr:ATP-binding protein [Chloroflexota bacterium]
VSRSRAAGRTSGTNVGRAMGIARSMGMSAAVVPSVSAAKSYQWQDDKAIQLTAMLRAQEELLRRATLEGAFLTDAYMLCRTERGAAAAEVAIRQAFHGSELPVVTPVQTRRLTAEEQAYIRLHALAFTPSTREERIAGALEAYKDTTMLLPLQLATYMAPGLFEEGAAVTVQERTPAFAFVPDMPGDVVLGHLFSTETGRLTHAPLRLSEDRMFHTAFASDTGYGKTVAAERLAVETTRLWKYRTVVFDFGAGWRRLLNVDVGESGRVEVFQVHPGAIAPLRWNPLQVGKRINPEQQMRATCELIRNAGQMGPRQLGFMRRALKTTYTKHGVLTSFREVVDDEKWSVVQDDEWAVIDVARAEWGLDHITREKFLSVAKLKSFERQAVAVHRSKAVDLVMWYEELLKIFSNLRQGTPDHTSLEGVLLRVEPFAEGEMERMYGRGEGSIALEELGMLGPSDDPWGISILEGGAEMDDFTKSVIFSLAGWHLYHDAVVRRRHNIGYGPQRKLQIF